MKERTGAGNASSVTAERTHSDRFDRYTHTFDRAGSRHVAFARYAHMAGRGAGGGPTARGGAIEPGQTRLTTIAVPVLLPSGSWLADGW